MMGKEFGEWNKNILSEVIGKKNYDIYNYVEKKLEVAEK